MEYPQLFGCGANTSTNLFAVRKARGNFSNYNWANEMVNLLSRANLHLLCGNVPAIVARR
jgi:hypothetical protein